MAKPDLTHYLADSPPSVVRLEIGKHFDALTDKQKRYAHHISRASFLGTRIVARQISPESEHIYDFILALHRGCKGDWEALKSKANINDQELTYLLEYAAQFLGNNGNYKSFGDAKFLPRCTEHVFAAAAAAAGEEAKSHYMAAIKGIWSADKPGELHLGYTEDGHMTTYYPNSPNITKADIGAVKDWMAEKGLLPENTRLRKADQGEVFEILITSAIAPSTGDIGSDTTYLVKDGPLAGKTIKLVYCDHAQEMKRIVREMRSAAACADNDTQRKMHEAYAKSFETGSLQAFKESQRLWVQDKGPMVESNIGFIETYRDPAGIRGEWEGFAAVVNKERTRAFEELVRNAEKLIPLLPWSKDFEKDKFLSPDFTSLEVLNFAGSGIPAGINIPNYDDIRQTLGFKNVSLGNVLSAKPPTEKIPFIPDGELELYRKYRDSAFEVQVGLHELTGHGCGKLLQETAPGEFNFNKDSPPVSPLTNKPITTWYKPGETWSSVFGSIAGAYEECRAELVAMFLSCEFPVLKIFGFGDGSVDMDGPAGDVLYVSYMSMARAGLASLEMWDPKSRKWGQAHSQARFSILLCFLEAGKTAGGGAGQSSKGDDGSGFCSLKYTDKPDGSIGDLTIHIDRSQILTLGRAAVSDYLQKLHIYKSTADVEAGTQFFERMTHVDADFWGAKVRDEVLRNKQPRRVFVQANTILDGDKVSLKEYEPSLKGMIESFVDREEAFAQTDC